jgi:hypothetical protein
MEIHTDDLNLGSVPPSRLNPNLELLSEPRPPGHDTGIRHHNMISGSPQTKFGRAKLA